MRTTDGSENAGAGSPRASQPGRADLRNPRRPVAGLDLDYLRRLVDSVPEPRSAKLSRLRQALADGVYSVDPAAVAERILMTWKGPRN